MIRLKRGRRIPLITGDGGQLPDLSLTVPPRVIRGAAAGSENCREIVESYGLCDATIEPTLAMKVRRARISAGITVTALAVEMGKGRVWLALREHGHKRLREEDARRLFEAIKLLTRRRAIAVGRKF